MIFHIVWELLGKNIKWEKGTEISGKKMKI